jgi:hypothetical protein
MTVRTVTNLPAVTHGETVRCLFAIELSTMSWVVAFNTPLSEKISRHALTGCKWKRLLELIEEVRARVSRETGRAVEVVSCYEAGYDGFWLHRKLEAHGIRNYVIDPASLQVDRRARRVKTDRSDTDRLLRSLMAYLRGEPKVWSVVRVPSVAEEDAQSSLTGSSSSLRPKKKLLFLFLGIRQRHFRLFNFGKTHYARKRLVNDIDDGLFDQPRSPWRVRRPKRV